MNKFPFVQQAVETFQISSGFGEFFKYVVEHHEHHSQYDNNFMHFVGYVRFRFPNSHGAMFAYAKLVEWDFETNRMKSSTPLSYSLMSIKFVSESDTHFIYDNEITVPQIVDSKDNFSAILKSLSDVLSYDGKCEKCGAYWMMKIIGYAKEARADK